MGQTSCPSNSWVIKSRSLSKLDNTFNSNSIFNTKVHWIFYKMVGAPSFLEPYLCKQPDLHSPPKKSFPLLQPAFVSLLHPYLFKNSYLQFPLTRPSSIPHQFLTFLCLRTTIPTIYTNNVFYLANSGCVKEPESLGVLWRLTLFWYLHSSLNYGEW